MSESHWREVAQALRDAGSLLYPGSEPMGGDASKRYREACDELRIPYDAWQKWLDALDLYFKAGPASPVPVSGSGGGAVEDMITITALPELWMAVQKALDRREPRQRWMWQEIDDALTAWTNAVAASLPGYDGWEET